MTDPLPNPTFESAVLRLLDRPVSEADLLARAADLAQPAEVRSVKTVALLVFRLRRESLALPVRSLRSVTAGAVPTPIPHRSGGVLRGICNIRGELILCADLSRLLDLAPPVVQTPEDEMDQRRMIVMGSAAESWTFEVDALIGVERFDLAAARRAPSTVEGRLGAFAASLIDTDSGVVTLLDADRVQSGLKAGLG